MCIAEEITRWYRENGRDFPWRKTDDPFEILVAELMLQKTSASQVLPIYEELLERWPTPEELSEASLDDIADVIYPLGLQNVRSKRFKGLAEDLVERFEGKIPDDEEELKSLKGVGEYISDSVLCMAFGKRRAMVDANAGRLFGRYFEGEKDYSAVDGWVREKFEELLPEQDFREFNLGVLDLGAEICRQTHPLCEECPMAERCEYRKGDE